MINDTHGSASCVTLLFLQHHLAIESFDRAICYHTLIY